jgi:hypothetical protein
MHSQGLHYNTLVNKLSIHNGLQSVLFVRSVAGADWPAVFLPSVASMGVFLPLNVRLS